MIEKYPEFRKFQKFVIVGVQRSGTRIAARIVAEDMGVPFIKSEDVPSFGALLRHLHKGPCAIHAPHCTHCIHTMNMDDVLVVRVVRDPKEVRASMKRVGWGGEWDERALMPEPYRSEKDFIAAKAMFWADEQAHLVHNVTIDYEDLKDHALFVDRDTRNSQNVKTAIDGKGRRKMFYGFYTHQTELSDRAKRELNELAAFKAEQAQVTGSKEDNDESRSDAAREERSTLDSEDA